MGDKYKIAYAYLDGIMEINEADAKLLTHINIAFGLIDKNGMLSTDGLRHMEAIKQIREWNPSIKLVLSVGGWGADGFSQLARTEVGRRTFAQSCAEYVRKQALDGIDIDWEYPCIGWSGIACDVSDKENYTLLLRELRSVLGKEKILSVAVGAGDYFLASADMVNVAAVCDYVQLMTYDMRAEGCFVAGHHTALYATEGDTEGRDVHDNVQRFIKAGVPREKLIIGAAFYLRIWRGVEKGAEPHACHGLLMPSKGDGVYGGSYTQLVNEFIDKNGYVRYRDDTAKAPYLFNGTDFVSYDDPESIAEKCRYIKENGLKGIMYWEHGCDETHELIKSIGSNL